MKGLKQIVFEGSSSGKWTKVKWQGFLNYFFGAQHWQCTCSSFCPHVVYDIEYKLA